MSSPCAPCSQDDDCLDPLWSWHQAVRRRKGWEAKKKQSARETEENISGLDRCEQLPWLAIPGELAKEKECFQTAGVEMGFQSFSHREGRAS